MNILAINPGHNGSAALLVDGKIKLGQFDVNENTVSFNSDSGMRGQIVAIEVGA